MPAHTASADSRPKRRPTTYYSDGKAGGYRVVVNPRDGSVMVSHNHSQPSTDEPTSAENYRRYTRRSRGFGYTNSPKVGEPSEPALQVGVDSADADSAAILPVKESSHVNNKNEGKGKTIQPHHEPASNFDGLKLTDMDQDQDKTQKSESLRDTHDSHGEMDEATPLVAISGSQHVGAQSEKAERSPDIQVPSSTPTFNVEELDELCTGCLIRGVPCDKQKPACSNCVREGYNCDAANTCTNCYIQSTPLWRRDPDGKPLCNACGLFLKLHGVVRPLSLRTDLIKKRNRGTGRLPLESVYPSSSHDQGSKERLGSPVVPGILDTSEKLSEGQLPQSSSTTPRPSFPTEFRPKSGAYDGADEGSRQRDIDNTVHQSTVEEIGDNFGDLEETDTSMPRPGLHDVSQSPVEKFDADSKDQLLEKDADIEAKDEINRRTTLWYAAEKRHETIVRQLLGKGTYIKAKGEIMARTTLWHAAQKGHEAIVRLLLENGADIKAKDKRRGRTPLSYAAEKGHEAVVRLLLENGADINAKDEVGGQTPLSWAAEKGHEATVRLLLENGADINAKDEIGDRTPLSWAAKNGHEAIVRLLLDEHKIPEDIHKKVANRKEDFAPEPLLLEEASLRQEKHRQGEMMEEEAWKGKSKDLEEDPVPQHSRSGQDIDYDVKELLSEAIGKETGKRSKLGTEEHEQSDEHTTTYGPASDNNPDARDPPSTATLDVEELSDFAGSDDERDGVIRPHQIEYAESDRSLSRSRKINSRDIDPSIMYNLNNLDCDDDSNESDSNEAEYHEFLRRRREMKRRRRIIMAVSGGKRAISESWGSDTDNEHLVNWLHSDEYLSSARRRRRRVGDRHNLSPAIPPANIEELEEPTSSDDDMMSIGEHVARELPYYNYLQMDMETDEDGDFGLPLKRPSKSSQKSSVSQPSVSLEDVDSGESYASELESILSEAPSLASSQSSMPIDINAGAVEELRALLLINDTLRPLYEEALHKVGAEKFQRNFRRLLLRYGRALSAEASTPVQVQAARFVRFAAFRVSIQIKNSLVEKDEQVGREKQQDQARAKVLAYLKQMEEAKADIKDEDGDSSEEESIYDLEDGIQTLESVKAFMVSSTAFQALCVSLKDWLNPAVKAENPGPLENTTRRPENLFGPCEEESRLPEQMPRHFENHPLDCKNEPGTCNHQPVPFEKQPVPCKEKTELCQKESESRRPAWKQYRNIVLDLFQRKVPPGHARISWTCRCGDRLRIQVPEYHQQAASTFAQQAAAPNSIITSQTSTSSSSTASSTVTSPNSRPQSPNTIPSSDPDTDTSDQRDPFIPAGTKQYMLLVVNTNTPNTLRPVRKLINVDVTDITCGGELFQRLQTAYQDLRNSNPFIKNPFTVPKTMHYIKLQLLCFKKSGTIVGPYEVNSIPSRKEVKRLEYSFSPCPPLIGPLPMPPEIFMHSFLDPADHFGPMAVSILPKKLDNPLCTASMNPTGWGFYIVEGINWPLVFWTTVVTLFVITVIALVWIECTGDIQGGMGIGQFCIGVVAVLASVWALYITLEKP
ncbi:hypothetical protein QBC43DRAFT_135738 [Cladorrhinum sp. PSN259]|nr:hypothetical protein QBC43DRAFT_135738 [Cladorrhinum sp. PSN259]